MKIADIKIQKRFKNTPPADWKLEQCRDYYKQHGELDREIVVNTNGFLVDGYVGYLVLLENNVEDAEVVFSNQASINKKTYVFGKHNGSDKEYVWRATRKAKADNIHVGSEVLVQTKFGIRTVTVTRIESSFMPPVATLVKRVIRCLTT